MNIKISFTDFWKDFNPEDNFFINLLKKSYHVEISKKPDLLFYSNYGKEYLKYNCLKIFYSSENVRPNFDLCDFAFTFDYDGYPLNYRLPLFALYDDVRKLIKVDDMQTFKRKQKFCNFIYSNANAKERIEFYNLLSKYKKVDSAGRLFNNINASIGPMPNDKLNFISDYKFTIAFENSSHPGYTTEKIFQPMLVGSIPIYWGNPLIHQDFNQRSFVNVREFRSYKEVVELITEIDNNDELYQRYLSEPYFIDNVIPQPLTDKALLSQLDYIISKLDKRPVSRTMRGVIANKKAYYFPVAKNIYKKVITRIKR